jgi:hypothetical protein
MSARSIAVAARRVRVLLPSSLTPRILMCNFALLYISFVQICGTKQARPPNGLGLVF